MAITVGTRYFNNDSGLTSHSFPVAIPGNAKVIAFIATENTTNTISAVQFNGSAMTQISGSPWTFSGGGGETQIAAYFIDTALGANSYNLTYTTSATTATTLTAFPLTGAISGAPESVYSDTQDNAASVVGDVGSLTVTAGAYVMACAINSAVTATVTVGGSVTLGDNSTASNARVTNAADIQATGGTKTATFTYSSTSTTKLMVAVSVAEAITGLSITSVTPSSFDDGRTGIVIAGSGFGASQGSSTLTIGGQAQTVTAWSDTSITFTSVRGSNSMGARSLTLTRA